MSVNSVSALQKTNFSTLPLERKLEIKALGRPLPLLNISQDRSCKGKSFCRVFKPQIYERNNWICGCEITNKLFCFPCLLFAKESDGSWIKTGVSDLSHLTQKIKKHEESMVHKNSTLDLTMLGKTDIREQLDNVFRRNIERHNDVVRKNRYVLSKIIDCVKFCGEFELALRGHDETTSSPNPGIFRGLINFTSALDGVLKDHFNTATVFKGTSKSIQNDLLSCMLQVCREQILSEIATADFVSVIADETSDVSSKYQLVVVLRYVLLNGKPVERFWTFTNPSGHDALSLANCIKEILAQIVKSDKEKLISQSYDGSNVMSGSNAGVQTLIQQDYPYAYFIHCYAHQLNLIMAKAASQNTQVRVFFANIGEIPSFFANSPQRVAILDEIVGKRVPHGSNTRWNFNSRTVQVVYENKDAILECLEKIENTSRQDSTINQAQGLRLKMEFSSFNFWLEVFYRIMPHVDILYNQMQKSTADSLKIKIAISSFETEVIKIRNNIDTIAAEYGEDNKAKRRRENTHISRNVAAKEVCDVILNQVRLRFSFTNHLLAANLFDSKHFPNYNKIFPEKNLKTVVDTYPFLKFQQLKSELQVIYMRDDFRNVSGVVDLLQFLIDNNVVESFSEVTKLLKIIATVPMTTSEAERCFSTLKRVKTFLRSTMEEERLTALAMLSIEKSMVTQCVDFNERVINIFSTKKERRLDFHYKHSTVTPSSSTLLG